MSLKPLSFKAHHVVIDASRPNRRRQESSRRYESQLRGKQFNPYSLSRVHPPTDRPVIQGFNRERRDEESAINHSNGASSSTNNSPRSQSPVEAAIKKAKEMEADKNKIKLPPLHNTCCNFFNPSLALTKNTILSKPKVNLKAYLSRMTQNVETVDRKTYTARGGKRKPVDSTKKCKANEIKTVTSINFYQQRPESRHNLQTVCDDLNRPVTSMKALAMGGKLEGKEGTMFCIDEELLSDD